MILTVIGGGSSQWMMSLMQDVYLLDAAGGGEIRLVDPDTESVELVAAMLRRFNQTRGKAFQISVFAGDEDRAAALAGADFVMSTFSPGGMDAFEHDLEIPQRYGVRQPVSMTVGPCGISAALRTVPAVYELVAEMEQQCPDALLLNVTNPMSAVTRAMNLAAAQVQVIGLCHEFHAFPRLMAAILGLQPPPELNVVEVLYRWLAEQGFTYTVAGVNHFIWITAAALDGRDMVPVIRDYARQHRDLRPADAAYSLTANYHAVKLALCRTFGFLPVVGDRHLIEFWPSLCNPRNGDGLGYAVVKTSVDERRHRRERMQRQVARMAAGEEDIDWTRSGEEMTEIMRARLTGDTVTAIMNLPNRGQVDGLPADAVVETLGTVSGRQVTPRPAGALPGAVGTLCRLHVEVHELTVRAALAGDRDLLVEALAVDPLSAGADFAELGSLADELLLANRRWLPRFFD